MKKCFMIMSVLAVAILSATPAFAVPWQEGDTIDYTLSNPVPVPGGGGNGGLFNIQSRFTDAWTNSFCLEITEYIYNGDIVADISKVANNGGYEYVDGIRGLASGGDEISPETDWLYAQYRTGNYQDAKAMQIAIWYLEGEITPSQFTSNQYYNTANVYVQAAETNAGTGSYGTWVLNLRHSNGGNAQSQLIYIPVPEPSIMLLLAMAFGAVGIGRKYLK